MQRRAFLQLGGLAAAGLLLPEFPKPQPEITLSSGRGLARVASSFDSRVHFYAQLLFSGSLLHAGTPASITQAVEEEGKIAAYDLARYIACQGRQWSLLYAKLLDADGRILTRIPGMDQYEAVFAIGLAPGGSWDPIDDLAFHLQDAKEQLLHHFAKLGRR